MIAFTGTATERWPRPRRVTVGSMRGLARRLGVAAIAALAGAAHAPAALAADPVVLASGTLQRCLGITPGQARFTGMSATSAPYCEQLPGAASYAQAGQRYQAGDRAGAVKLVTGAAQARHPLAQLRLAVMYEGADGVPRDKKAAFGWYGRAAAVGEPAAQRELGGYYEDGDGVAENWDLAAKLYQASATQGWSKGQLALGRAYEFGIGVPQDRQQAVGWFARAGAQGLGQGEYFARWLRDPLNNIGFRNQAEHDLVIGGKLRFGLLSRDPTGITFHSSQQRIAWLTGQRREVDLSEAHTMWSIRSGEYQQCQRGGGSNCVDPGPDPARR